MQMVSLNCNSGKYDFHMEKVVLLVARYHSIRGQCQQQDNSLGAAKDS